MYAANPERITLVPKRVIVVTGTSGTGKSTLAAHVAREFGCPVVSKDMYASVFPASHGPEYKEKYRSEVHELVKKATTILLSLGCSVIVDVVHSEEIQTPGWDGWIEWYQQVAIRHQAEADFIRLEVTKQTLRERLERRGSPFDADKLSSPEGWLNFMKEQPIDIDTHPTGGLILNNDRPFAETLTEAKIFLLRPLLSTSISLVR